MPLNGHEPHSKEARPPISVTCSNCGETIYLNMNEWFHVHTGRRRCPPAKSITDDVKGATTNEQRLKELLKVAERAREVSLPPSMRGRVVLPAEYDAAFADLSRLFDPATCAELVNEVLRLHGENETFRNADYSFMQKIEEQP